MRTFYNLETRQCFNIIKSQSLLSIHLVAKCRWFLQMYNENLDAKPDMRHRRARGGLNLKGRWYHFSIEKWL